MLVLLSYCPLSYKKEGCIGYIVLQKCNIFSGKLTLKSEHAVQFVVIEAKYLFEKLLSYYLECFIFQPYFHYEIKPGSCS